MRDNQDDCGFDAFVVMKEAPRLKSMSLSETKNTDGKSFRDVLKEMIFSVINDSFLSADTEYADGIQLADNQRKFLIFKQGGTFTPFSFLNTAHTADSFSVENLPNASGLIFKIRKGTDTIWCYQHLWSIMVPNKKKTNLMTRLCKFENQTVFEEQTESLLTIAHKVDILIINGHLVTGNTALLQKSFGFQEYIYQSAAQAVSSITAKGVVANAEKLTEYISRGKIVIRHIASLRFSLCIVDKENTIGNVFPFDSCLLRNTLSASNADIFSIWVLNVGVGIQKFEGDNFVF